MPNYIIESDLKDFELEDLAMMALNAEISNLYYIDYIYMGKERLISHIVESKAFTKD